MKFTPEDFAEHANKDTLSGLIFARALADTANQKIEEWLKSAPKMYLNISEYGVKEWQDSGLASNKLTHTGKIVDIKKWEEK